MSSLTANYGRRLTEEQFHQGIEEIHNLVLQRASGKESEEELEERIALLEFQLSIDRQLGEEFPQELRKQLVDAYQDMYREQQTISARPASGPLAMLGRAWAMRKLTNKLLKKCRSILSEQDYRSMFDLGKSRRPILPFNPFARA